MSEPGPFWVFSPARRKVRYGILFVTEYSREELCVGPFSSRELAERALIAAIERGRGDARITSNPDYERVATKHEVW